MSTLALCATPAHAASVWRAADIARLPDDPCPLAVALESRRLDMRGDVQVEVTKKHVSITIGDSEVGRDLRFSLKAGEDLDAMRDTVLGKCTRTAGIAGVSSVQFDLREDFDAADSGSDHALGVRSAAVQDAVERLRRQRKELARAIKEATPRCTTNWQVSDPPDPTEDKLASTQAQLAWLTSVTTAMSSSLEACRALDRARPLAYDLVEMRADETASIREVGAEMLASKVDARVKLTRELGVLVSKAGYSVSTDDTLVLAPWSRLRNDVSALLRLQLGVCERSTKDCSVPLDVAQCSMVGDGYVARWKDTDPQVYGEWFVTPAGGEAWCGSAEGREVCAEARERYINYARKVATDACTETYTTGEGPALLARAKAAKEAEVEEALRLFSTIAAMAFGGGGGSSAGGGARETRDSQRECRTVYTCTCQSNGQQTTSRVGCPYVNTLGCDGLWDSETHEECK